MDDKMRRIAPSDLLMLRNTSDGAYGDLFRRGSDTSDL